MATPGLTMEVIGTEGPVQFEGTIDGVPFYFRARYDTWEFGAGDDPVDVMIDEGTRGGFYRSGSYDPEGDGFGASYMPIEVAKQIILECADEFRRSRGGPK